MLPLSSDPACRQGFLGCPRWDSLRSRILAKQAGFQDGQITSHGPSRLVCLQSSLGSAETASITVRSSRNRRRRSAKAQVRRLPEAVPEHRAHCHKDPSSRCVELHARRDVLLPACLEHQAFSDLAELEKCGMQVKWSRAELLHPEACEASEPKAAGPLGSVCSNEKATDHGQLANQGPEVRHGPEEQLAELTAALRDLRELHDSGLAVRLPS